MGVEEGLDGGAGELEDELYKKDEKEQFHHPMGGNEVATQLVPDARGDEVESENNRQHDTPGAATSQEYAHISPLKVGKDTADDLSRSLECVGTEEDPKENDERECQQPGHKTRQTSAGYRVKPWFAQLVDA